MMSNSVAALSDEEVEEAIEALRTDGYVVISNAVDPAALQDLADHLDDEFERAKTTGELFDGGGSLAGHLNCYPGQRSRFVHEAIVERGIVRIVEQLAPETVDRVRATTNYNLPESTVQHFHSDGLYTEAFYICNVAVVDTDLTNGAIDVIPGTHKRFYKFWRYVMERKYRESKRICMSQGDALVRISTAWHRGMPNLSDAPRPMMSLTFGEDGAPDGDPFEVNGGQVQFTPNWYGTDRLSQVRERAFVAMPWLYSSLRFGRSLFGNKGYSSW